MLRWIVRSTLVLLSCLALDPSRAAAQTVQVTASPSSYTNVPAHTTYQAATFTVTNLDDSQWFRLTCGRFGDLVCEGVSEDSVYLLMNDPTEVTVHYTSGAAGASATIRLTATPVSFGNKATGSASVTMGASRITFLAPSVTAGGTIDVHTRRPVLRAEYNAPSTPDTLTTAVSWRGSSILSKVMKSDRLVEWEVDSAGQLAISDSVPFQATFCTLPAPVAQCTTEKIMVRLANDQKPILDFRGIPRGTWGGGYGTGFGPGVGLSGAEVTTGFSTPAYIYRGAPRSAAMVYSTRTSYPRVLIPVNLELPWPVGTPDEVKVVLFDGATRLDSTRVTSTACVTGGAATCRTVVEGDFSASTFATPTRKWLRVEVSVTSGGTLKQSSDSVEVVLVDRRSTQYGSGWWPSAQSKLVAAGNDRILVDAGGNATIFRGTSTASVFFGPPGSTTRLVSVTGGWELQPRGSTARTKFDTYGRLIRVSDIDGNRDSLTYAGTSDTLLSIRDPGNNLITFGYNATTKRLESITSLSGAAGARTTRVLMDTAYFVTGDSLAGGPAYAGARYSYQRYGSPSYRSGLLTRVISGSRADTTLLVYDTLTSTYGGTSIRPAQVSLAQVNDENGNPATPTTTVKLYERQGWHALRSLDSVYVEMKDPRNNWTRSLLNRYAQPVRTWDALGLLARAGYDDLGRVLWTEGKNGDSSRVYSGYDNLGRVARTYILRSPTDLLRLDSLVYDANHRVIKRIDSRGQADSAAYDAEGHLVYARDPAGNVTQFRYTADGLRDSVLAPGQGTWSRVTFDATWKNVYQRYNVAGRLESQTTYDSLGRATETRGLQSTTILSGAVQWRWWRTRTRYAVTNAVDSTSQGYWTGCTDSACSAPNGSFIFTARSESKRDAAGRDTLGIQWVGTKARKTKVRYDRLGRVIVSWPYADSTAIRDSMVYDIAGNLVKRFTRRGDSITSVFDARNRDTLTTIPGVGNLRRTFGGPNDQLTRLWYDSPVDSIGGVNGTRAWEYDARGRLVGDTLWLGGSSRFATYLNDSYERPSSVSYGGVTTRYYGYETARGNLDSLRTSEGDTLALTFDARGRISASTLRAPSSYGRWLTGDWTYKVTGELLTHYQRINASNPADTFNVGSTHPASGLLPEGEYDGSSLESVYDYQDQNGGALRVESQDMGYDAVNRLTAWTGKLDGNTQAALSYGFDEGGNIVPAGETRTYDTTTNRLLLRVANGHRYRYGYDQAGNTTTMRDSLTTGGLVCQWEYGYDALERLVRVRARADTTLPLALVAKYGYDVLGNRIVRRVYDSPCISGVTTGYTRYAVWDGQVQFEWDSAGGINGMGNSYVWGPGVDNLLVAKNSIGERLWAITDKLGSIRAWVGQSGTWRGNRRYDPYGNVLVDSTKAGVTNLPYRWVGREYDPETGFYFMRARYYDPQLARFTQEDPIGEAGGPNRYMYVEGQPLEARDPSGLTKDWEAFSGTGALDALSFLLDAQANADGSFAASVGWGLLPIPEPGVETTITYSDGSSITVQGRVSSCGNSNCPGGMTSREYYSVISSYRFMQASAAAQVNALVAAGRVVMESWGGSIAATVRTMDVLPRIYINRTSAGGNPLERSSPSVAFLLLHETFHLIFQVRNLGPYEFARRYGRTEADIGRMEATASAYACQQITTPCTSGRDYGYAY